MGTENRFFRKGLCGNVIKKLAPYDKGYGKETILAPLFIVGEVALEILIPLVMSNIIKIGLPNSDYRYVFQQGGLMILLALLSLVFGALSARCASVAGAGFAKNLRAALFERIQGFSFANIDKFSTASLITRTTTDVTNVQHVFMMSLRMLFRAPMMLICALVIAIRLNGKLALVFAVALPVLATVTIVLMKKGYPLFQEMLKKYDGLNASVQENLTAIRVVKAFVRSDYETEKFTASADDVRKAQFRAEKMIVYSSPIMQLVMYSCMIAVCWFGGNMIVSGTMQDGDLMAFFSYVSQILMSLMMIAMIFLNFVLTRASMVRIVEVLDEVSDVRDPENPVTEVMDGSIDFEKADFAYNGDRTKYVLEDIDLHIRSGETIGIIGATGSSKTSLVQLIPRLYDVTDGCVKVGGRDVREYGLKELRSAVAMVLQKNELFSGTIRENLLWGKADATDEELVEVCKTACADDFIQSFPDGYDTVLGQGGTSLSGGQKQRLCIARALLCQPKILILDDSTSAVDTATDAKIRAGFRTRFGHVTTLIIAQRIASVEEANRIVILDNGKISDVGTHEELLGRSAIYREIYESQKKGVTE